MAYTIETGTNPLRKEVVDSMVKQIAKRSYKFKQAVAIVPTSAWKNTFFREDPTVLSGASGNSQHGIPRGANFPQATVAWESVSVRIVKHGLEDNIPWEDIISSDINVQARTIFKITEGIVKSVDDDIYNSLIDDYVINVTEELRVSSFALGSATNGGCWNQSSAAIIDNFMYAAQIIGEFNYDTGDLMCFVNSRDKRSIMKFLADKGAQWSPIATGIATNGNIGQVAGVKIIESQSVPTSYALVVKPKVCATYKELVSLRSTTVEDPYKSVKIRCVEEGVVELTDPLAVVLIKNTNGTEAY